MKTVPQLLRFSKIFIHLQSYLKIEKLGYLITFNNCTGAGFPASALPLLNHANKNVHCSKLLPNKLVKNKHRSGDLRLLKIDILHEVILFRTLLSDKRTKPFQIMANIEIEKVTLTNIGELQKISRETFYETFSAANTKENMDQYLENEFFVDKLTSELNNKNSEFFFAILDSNIIGYLKVNTGQSQTELQDDKALEIERIYVYQEFYGKNVGQLLVDKAIKMAREKKVDFIWLGVWEENQRAIHFYKKNGFVEFDKHIFKLGNDEQTDIMMKLHLKSNAPKNA